MNSIFQAWSMQAQVARAAYANIVSTANVQAQIDALKNAGMSDQQARLFLGLDSNGQVQLDKGFEILSDTFSEIPEPGRIFDSGFSATFLRDRSVNEITLAVRGTELE